MPADGKAFREYVQLYHEVGNENYDIPTTNPASAPLPRVDPHTESYRPGRARDQLPLRAVHAIASSGRRSEEAHAYSSYTFGDPATPIPRGYLGDPTKIRILHAGAEMFHVFHLHGGGIRWRLNPRRRHDLLTTQDTGLNKYPKARTPPRRGWTRRPSARASPTTSRSRAAPAACSRAPASSCSTATSPSTTSRACGASGASSTRGSPTSRRCPTASPRRTPVDSAGLIGTTMPDGTTHHGGQPRRSGSTRSCRRRACASTTRTRRCGTATEATRRPLYLGEPEDKRRRPTTPTRRTASACPGHPALLPGDVAVGPQDRPEILFNPLNGRPAYPLLRPHLGKRPPFSRATGTPARRGSARPATAEDDPGRRARSVGQAQGRHLPRRRAGAALQHRRDRRQRAGHAPGSRPTARDATTARSTSSPRTSTAVLAGHEAHRAAGDPRQHRRLHRGDAHEPDDGRARVRRLLEGQPAHPPRPVRHAGAPTASSPACPTSSRSGRSRPRTCSSPRPPRPATRRSRSPTPTPRARSA